MLAAALFIGASLLLSFKVPPLFNDVSLVGAAALAAGAVFTARIVAAVKKSGGLVRDD